MTRLSVFAPLLVMFALFMIGLGLGITRSDVRIELSSVCAECDSDAPRIDRDRRYQELVMKPRRELVKMLQEPAHEPAPPQLGTPSRSRLRVYGQVQSNCGPVADYDLSFRITTDARTKEVDWDFTDEDGRYEVELCAGCYSIYSNEGIPVATIDLIEGSQEVVLDLCVPTGS